MFCLTHSSEASTSIINNSTPDVSVVKTNPIPSILEIVDVKNKIFQVSVVALKKAPIMMCQYKHHPVSLILDTSAEHNVIGDTVVKRYENSENFLSSPTGR